MKHKILLLALTIGFMQQVIGQCTNLNSKINNSDVHLADLIHTGKKDQVSLTVYNIGECDWRNSEVALRVTIARGPSGTTNAQEEMLTTNGDIKMDRTEVDSKTGYGKFIYEIEGPGIAGEYVLQFQLVYKHSKLFGAKVQKDITVINKTLDEKDCKLLAAITSGDIKMPTKVLAGKKFPVSIIVKNTGSCDWITQTNKVELRVVCISFPSSSNRERDKLVPGDGYVQATERQVDAGEFAEFEYNIIGPSIPGDYILQWQMTNGGAAFGAKYQKHVTVTINPADCDVQGTMDVTTFPTEMVYNKDYDVVVRVYNTGECNWTSASKVEIRCHIISKPGGNSSPQIAGLMPNNGIYPTGSDVIEPHKYFEVRYKVKGPYMPGYYKLRWELYEMGKLVSGVEDEKSGRVSVPK